MFKGSDPTAPIGTCLWTSALKSKTVAKLQAGRDINCAELNLRIAELHPLVEYTFEQNQQNPCETAWRGELPHFEDGDYVLLSRKDFHANEKF